MNDIHEYEAIFAPMMHAIALQFGPECEVVLHDLNQDYASTIIKIENGHITGRKVGDCGSNLGLQVLRGTEKDGNRYNYVTKTKTGKTLRSTSIYFRNDAGKAVAALCINQDITELMMASDILKKYTYVEQRDQEIFASNVNDLLEALLQEAQELTGKPVMYMDKDDKLKFIDYLDRKGGFLITKSGVKVCKYLGISKYTLYTYLEICKKARPPEASEDAPEK